MGPSWLFLFFFFCPMGLFLGSRSGSKTFLGPTNEDYQFLFWKYSPIFLFFIRKKFGPFCTFWVLRGYFWGWGQVQKLFWDQLTQTNNFYFGSIALSCFFETFPGGWLGGLENLILMKTQSSAQTWTWTLDFDLGFVNSKLQ